MEQKWRKSVGVGKASERFICCIITHARGIQESIQLRNRKKKQQGQKWFVFSRVRKALLIDRKHLHWHMHVLITEFCHEKRKNQYIEITLDVFFDIDFLRMLNLHIYLKNKKWQIISAFYIVKHVLNWKMIVFSFWWRNRKFDLWYKKLLYAWLGPFPAKHLLVISVARQLMNKVGFRIIGLHYSDVPWINGKTNGSNNLNTISWKMGKISLQLSRHFV